jgi:hypothetical protein
VFSGDKAECSKEEHQVFHVKRGCCQATIIYCLGEVDYLSKKEDKAMDECKHLAMGK